MPNWYEDVPKDEEGNLLYRDEVWNLCAADAEFRETIWQACKEDVLLWMNLFCFVYEPRPQLVNGVEEPMVLPFITWTHQDPVILEIKQYLGFEDVGVEKSRGEGLSWIGVLLALHDWLFVDMSAIGLVSRNELAVDSPDDPDSLFWKIDWELTQLPPWMAGVSKVHWKRDLQKHSLKNIRNGSSITGYSATADVASGGRKKWFLMDELAKFPRPDDTAAMASTQFVTNSRLVVSTPKGAVGAYYDLMHKESSMIPIRVHWSDNPTKNRGLYNLVKGVPIAEDPINNPLPEDYSPPSEKVRDRFDRLKKNGFVLDKAVRSPWYDHECDRAHATPQSIAQELDFDYGGSVVQYFPESVRSVAKKSCQPPIVRGEISVDREGEWTFIIDPNGPVKLWVQLDANKLPPLGEYASGGDVATGSGGQYCSNSVFHIVNLNTKEQVLEYATKTSSEVEFADECIALCRMFHDAYFAWENMGPGIAFGRRVLDRRYGDIYYRSSLDYKGNVKSKKIGFHNRGDARKVMFSDLKRSIIDGGIIIRSHDLAGELPEYIRDGDLILHQQNNRDSADHGDRIIAIGVAVQAMKDRPREAVETDSTRQIINGAEPPRGTIAHLLWERGKSAKKDNMDRCSTASLSQTASWSA